LKVIVAISDPASWGIAKPSHSANRRGADATLCRIRESAHRSIWVDRQETTAPENVSGLEAMLALTVTSTAAMVGGNAGP
jgi:hypothetical protein